MPFTSGTRTHARTVWRQERDKKVFWSYSLYLWSRRPILFTFSILCVTPARVTIVLISSRPSWRRRACFSLCGFGFERCGLCRARKNHLFRCAFLLYVSHLQVLSAFLKRESEPAAEDSVALSSVALAIRPQSRQQEQGVYSVLITCLIGSLRSSYFTARCAEGLFYWFRIKSCN